MTKIPRYGTRRWHVYEELWIGTRQSLPGFTTWGEAESAYQEGGKRLTHSSVGMNVARTLRTYADKVSRGRYVLKPEFENMHPDGAKPCPPGAPCFGEHCPSCKKHDADGGGPPRESTTPALELCPPGSPCFGAEECAKCAAAADPLERMFELRGEAIETWRGSVRLIAEIDLEIERIRKGTP